MKKWSPWESIRRQVTLSGHITGADGRPVAGTRIVLVPRRIGATGKARPQRDEWTKQPDHTRSRSDGLYFFLDLPSGHYTLRAVDTRTGQSVDERVALKADKNQGTERVSFDIRFPAGA